MWSGAQYTMTARSAHIALEGGKGNKYLCAVLYVRCACRVCVCVPGWAW